MTTLVVTSAFSTYGVGQTITDDATVAAILAGTNRASVVVVADGSPSSPGSGSSSSTTQPQKYVLSAVTSYAATHSFPYPPRVTLIDASGAEVETDVAYAASQVLLTFAAPFTGTLWLG